MRDDLDFKSFPTTRYQGSKRKILPWIYDALKDLHFETALDACGGSGSVSYLLKRMNKSVTYNDKLKFNWFIGKAIIENDNIKFTDTDLNNLLNNGLATPDLIQTIFKGVYYLDRENRWLDDVAHGIFNMNHYHGQELEIKKSIAYYALFQACLIKRPFNLFHRNNLHIRTTDVERNFGNKKTWERGFAEYFSKFLLEANSLVFHSGRKCKATNLSIFDIPDEKYDLVYIDPPYVKRNRKSETANYLECYHFLEGLANYPTWESSIDFQSKNFRFKRVEGDESFSKQNIYHSFQKIFEKFQESILVVSYKKGGVPSIEYLVKQMKMFKKKVYTRSQHYIYALNRQNGDAQKNREVLIIGE